MIKAYYGLCGYGVKAGKSYYINNSASVYIKLCLSNLWVEWGFFIFISKSDAG
jgi:hypothetical protein